MKRLPFKKEYMHKDVVTAVHEMLFTGVYHKHEIRSEEIQIGDKFDPYKGFVVKDNNKRSILIPSKEVKKMPLKVIEDDLLEIVDGKRIFHVATFCKSMQIPSSEKMSVRQYFDDWFPLEHTDPKDLLLNKIMVQTARSSQSYNRYMTKQGFGKDGIVNVPLLLCGRGRKFDKGNFVKLASGIEEGYTYFNEISGMLNMKDIFQSFFESTGAGDDYYEHETTGSTITKSKYKISDYGYNHGYNYTSYYLNSGKPAYEQIFGPAVIYRLIPFKLEGQVIDTNFMTQNIDVQGLKDEAFDYFVSWIGRSVWIDENFKKLVLPNACAEYLDKFSFAVEEGEKTSRWKKGFYDLSKMTYLYCKDGDGTKTEQFEEWASLMELFYKRHRAYIEDVKNYGLM